MEFEISLTNCIHAQMAEEIVVLEGVTRIGKCAFYECYYLERIILPDGVKKLDERAFDGCNGVVEIVLPDSITEIAASAFCNCRDLPSVRIPAGGRTSAAVCIQVLQQFERDSGDRGQSQL